MLDSLLSASSIRRPPFWKVFSSQRFIFALLLTYMRERKVCRSRRNLWTRLTTIWYAYFTLGLNYDYVIYRQAESESVFAVRFSDSF
jgi:hypothetical protein